MPAEGVSALTPGDDGDDEALGAVTGIVTAGAGFFVSLGLLLPVTVSLTDLTLVALAAMATCALNSRGVEFESTVPRAHELVPSWAHPKVNLGVWLDGVVASLRTTLGTVPPLAQALTVHWAVCPRWTLASSRVTRTHS